MPATPLDAVKKIEAWNEHNRHNKTLPEDLVMHIGVSYLLRKWAALQVYRVETDASLFHTKPVTKTPIVFSDQKDDEDEGEGGSGGWTIYDDNNMLAIARPDLASEYSGLARFMEGINQMLEMAVEKGWKEVGLFGFGADIAWVKAEELNIAYGEDKINIVNYQPAEADCERYATFIMDLVGKAKARLGVQGG